MTVAAALRSGASELTAVPTETPALESAVLLADALGLTKERLFACMEDSVRARGMASFRRSIDLRRRSVPVAYIRGSKEFYGYTFSVDRRVLIPRPDTESLVEVALETIADDSGVRRLHDVGTGSGCIAISLKATCPKLSVSVSDREPDCLAVCRINERRILGHACLSVHVADLLSGVPGPLDMVVANLPYLSDEECARLTSCCWPEPMVALNGGRGGAELTLRLITQASGLLRTRGYLLLETTAEHVTSLRSALVRVGFRGVVVHNDIAGRPRVIRARKR